MTATETRHAVEQIQEGQAEHRRLVKSRIRITNSAQAYIARQLGYTADMEEAEREKMWRKASGLMKHIINPEKSKVPKDTEKWAKNPVITGMVLACNTAARSFVKAENERKKQLRDTFKTMPVAKWIDDIVGISHEGAAFIQGEVGHFWDYDSAGKVWKRMGLAVMPDGTRQRKARGVDGIEQQYSPYRRSTMWNFGSSMIKANGTYRHYYDERKEYEMARDIPRGHAHNRAQRYMEKRFLKDFWLEWMRYNPDQTWKIKRDKRMVDELDMSLAGVGQYIDETHLSPVETAA